MLDQMDEDAIRLLQRAFGNFRRARLLGGDVRFQARRAPAARIKAGHRDHRRQPGAPARVTRAVCHRAAELGATTRASAHRAASGVGGMLICIDNREIIAAPR